MCRSSSGRRRGVRKKNMTRSNQTFIITLALLAIAGVLLGLSKITWGQAAWIMGPILGYWLREAQDRVAPRRGQMQ